MSVTVEGVILALLLGPVLLAISLFGVIFCVMGVRLLKDILTDCFDRG